jgi:hypothetical protein
LALAKRSDDLRDYLTHPVNLNGKWLNEIGSG